MCMNGPETLIPSDNGVSNLNAVDARNQSLRAIHAHSIQALKMRVRRSNWRYLRLAMKRQH